MARGFIRAEVINCDDLVASGSLDAACTVCTLRLQRRDYVVQNGDILNIRLKV